MKDGDAHPESLLYDGILHASKHGVGDSVLRRTKVIYLDRSEKETAPKRPRYPPSTEEP